MGGPGLKMAAGYPPPGGCPFVLSDALEGASQGGLSNSWPVAAHRAQARKGVALRWSGCKPDQQTGAILKASRGAPIPLCGMNIAASFPALTSKTLLRFATFKPTTPGHLASCKTPHGLSHGQ